MGTRFPLRRRARQVSVVLAAALAGFGLVGIALRLGVEDPVPGTLESRLAWPAGGTGAAGLSGLLVAPGGGAMLALSDQGALFPATATRDADGRLVALTPGPPRIVAPPPGADWPDTWFYDDSEGLARMPDGRIAVSFEGLNRITIHDETGAFADWIDVDPLIADLPVNKGLEAVTATPGGLILAIPEAWPRDAGRVPVLSVQAPQDRWEIAAWLPTARGYAPVGLDIDEAGRLYLLERRLRWWRGFSTRLRRLRLERDVIMEDRVLLQTAFGRHGNLEGIAVWRGADGTLRASMVSDDNGWPVLRQEIVEYRLPD